MDPKYILFSSFLLVHPAISGMFQRSNSNSYMRATLENDREYARDKAEHQIKNEIIQRLTIAYQMAQDTTIQQSQRFCNLVDHQHPLIDNSAAFIAYHKINQYISKSQHSYDPHTQSPQDWYHSLPLETLRTLAKQLCFDKTTINTAYPKKRLFS